MRRADSAAKAKAGEKGSAALKQAVDDAQYNYALLAEGRRRTQHRLCHAGNRRRPGRPLTRDMGQGNRQPRRTGKGRVSCHCSVIARSKRKKCPPSGQLSSPTRAQRGQRVRASPAIAPMRITARPSQGLQQLHHGVGHGQGAVQRLPSGGKEAMFGGKGVKGLGASPDSMWGKVSCLECHGGVRQEKRRAHPMTRRRPFPWPTGCCAKAGTFASCSSPRRASFETCW